MEVENLRWATMVEKGQTMRRIIESEEEEEEDKKMDWAFAFF